GDNSVKVIGPDLDELERLAERLKGVLDTVAGVENVGIFRIKGQPNLEFTVDRQKCMRWNVSVADVENAIKIAVGGATVTQMIEGEKTFEVVLRWPQRLRGSEQAILDIPIEVTGNTVTPNSPPAVAPSPVASGGTGVSPTGTTAALPSVGGSIFSGSLPVPNVARLRLRQLVTPVNAHGEPDPNGSYLRTGASTIYREQPLALLARSDEHTSDLSP